MTITNSTADILNYAQDLQIEYNIKIILLAILFIYSAILLYFSFNWEGEELWKKVIKIFIMQIPSALFLFFFPFYTLFLLRGASWEILYTLMIAYFSYVFIVIMISGQLGLFTLLANLIGFDTSIKKIELKNK